jgi:hypothetical protein
VAQLALSLLGSGLGGPPGAIIGAFVGGMIDRNWIFPKPPIVGPRLDNLKLQTSANGVAINQLWGTMRLAGNVIWAARTQEVSNEDTQGNCVTGKIKTITYLYNGTFAIGICRGPITSLVRIWADTKLIYSIRDDNHEVTSIDGLNFRLYLGDEDQGADPTIESYENAGNVPGFRGLCYIVFKEFPLAEFGNRIPNFTFEVSTSTNPGVPWVPILGTNVSAANTDWVVPYSDGMRALIENSGDWAVIDLIKHEPILTKHISGVPLTTALDIDENNVIYTVAPGNCFLGCKIARFDGDTLAFIDDSVGECYVAYKMRVVRNPSFPMLYWIDFFGNIRFAERTVVFDANPTCDPDLLEAAGKKVSPPTGTNFVKMSIDHTTGTCWAVATNDPFYTETWVFRIRPDGNLGYWRLAPSISDNVVFDTEPVPGAEEILYDPDTAQIILGTHNPLAGPPGGAGSLLLHPSN